MSKTLGRVGTTTSVAQRIASVTAADMFGGVSIKTHSVPSCFACFTMSAMPRKPALRGGSPVRRSACHNVSEPCGSASTSRQGRVGLWM